MARTKRERKTRGMGTRTKAQPRRTRRDAPPARKPKAQPHGARRTAPVADTRQATPWQRLLDAAAGADVLRGRVPDLVADLAQGADAVGPGTDPSWTIAPRAGEPPWRQLAAAGLTMAWSGRPREAAGLFGRALRHAAPAARFPLAAWAAACLPADRRSAVMSALARRQPLIAWIADDPMPAAQASPRPTDDGAAEVIRLLESARSGSGTSAAVRRKLAEAATRETLPAPAREACRLVHVALSLDAARTAGALRRVGEACAALHPTDPAAVLLRAIVAHRLGDAAQRERWIRATFGSFGADSSRIVEQILSANAVAPSPPAGSTCAT